MLEQAAVEKTMMNNANTSREQEIALGRNEVWQARETVINGFRGRAACVGKCLHLQTSHCLCRSSEFEPQRKAFWLESNFRPSSLEVAGVSIVSFNLWSQMFYVQAAPKA